VDYSGRSVIVVSGTQAQPVRFAEKNGLELFKPFIYAKPKRKAMHHHQAAKEMSSRQIPLYGPSRGRDSRASCALNRAPTLHRLGIQAFEPYWVEAKPSASSARLHRV